jgi:hypothetical protein
MLEIVAVFFTFFLFADNFESSCIEMESKNGLLLIIFDRYFFVFAFHCAMSYFG